MIQKFVPILSAEVSGFIRDYTSRAHNTRAVLHTFNYYASVFIVKLELARTCLPSELSFDKNPR